MKVGDKYYSRYNMYEVVITTILEQYIIYKTEGIFGHNTSCATLEEFKRDFSISYKDVQIEHVSKEIDTLEQKITLLSNQLYLAKEALVSVMLREEGI